MMSGDVMRGNAELVDLQGRARLGESGEGRVNVGVVGDPLRAGALSTA